MPDFLYMTPYEWGKSAPKGWQKLVFQMVRDLEEIAKREGLENFFVTDVKEKYGDLSVSLSYYSDAIDKRVDEAEALAAKTCIRCGGRAGAPKARTGWISNACNACETVEEMRQSIMRL